MKRVIVMAAALVAGSALLPFSPASHGQETAEPDLSRANIIRVNPALIQSPARDEDFSDRWFRYRNYVANELPDEAAAEFSDLVALQKQAQVRRGVEIAQAMVYEGSYYLQRGEAAKARTLFSSAIVLDPSSGEAYAALAWATLRSDPLAILSFLRYNISALRHSLSDFWALFVLSANVGLMLLVGLCLASLLFSIALLRRHGALLFHDLMEFTLTPRGQEWGVRLLFVVVLAVPIFLLLGAWWVVLYWIAIMLTYATFKERILAALVLVVSIAIPVVSVFYKVLYGAYRDPAIHLLVAAREPGDPRGIIGALETYVAEHPTDVDVQFALGTQMARIGRYEEALAVFRRLVELSPGYQMAYVNMGNVFFHLHDYENAIKNYQKSLTIDPRTALTNFNIKAAYSERFDFQTAEDFMRKAREIDSGAVDRYLARDDVKVVDDVFSTNKIWRRMLSAKVSDGHERDRSLLGEFAGRREVVTSLTSSPFYPTLLVLTLIAAGYYLRRRKTCAVSCIKCGRPYCRKCQRGVGEDRYCSQCAHIFLVKDGISEAARLHKFNEIQSFNATTARWMFWSALLFPGFEQMLGEKAIRGFAVLAGWGFLMSSFFLQPWFFMRPAPFTMYTDRFLWALVVALVLIYYAVHNVRNILNPKRFNDPSDW